MNTQQIREFIREGVCPFCKKGPFKSLPVHTCKVHKVDKWQLRDMAGLTSSDPISSQEFIARARELAVERHEEGTFNGPGKPRGANKNRTRAGLDKHLKAISEYNESTPKAIRALNAAKSSANISDETRVKRSKAFKALVNSPEFVAKMREVRRRPENIERLRNLAKERWERIGLKPCGTVAAYKRGCRCDSCKAAKAASRP